MINNVDTKQPIITPLYPLTWSLDPSDPTHPSLVLAVMDFLCKGDSESTFITAFNMIDQTVEQGFFNQTITSIIQNSINTSNNKLT